MENDIMKVIDGVLLSVTIVAVITIIAMSVAINTREYPVPVYQEMCEWMSGPGEGCPPNPTLMWQIITDYRAK